MTIKDKSAIQRLLGVIEGVACTLDDKAGATIQHSVETISEILERDGAK